jgi:hypothetical protein
MNGPERFFESGTVLHGQHEFGNQVTGMLAENGRTKCGPCGLAQHFDKAMRFPIGNRTIQIVNANTIHTYFVSNRCETS